MLVITSFELLPNFRRAKVHDRTFLVDFVVDLLALKRLDDPVKLPSFAFPHSIQH